MNRSFGMGRSSLAKAVAIGSLALGSVAMAGTAAQAQDRLNFEGAANLSDAPGSGGTLLFIDFLTDGAVTGPPTGTVVAVETISGAFDPEIVANETEGVITDLTVGAEGVVGLPVNPFLTIGGYTFTLDGASEGNAFGPISLVPVGGSTAGFFGVFGSVTGGDFGTTMRSYEGVFTAQFAGMTPEEVFTAVNSGGTLPVAFSAEFTIGEAAVIPEPSTYLLVATGLGVLGLISRRRRTQG